MSRTRRKVWVWVACLTLLSGTAVGQRKGFIHQEAFRLVAHRILGNPKIHGSGWSYILSCQIHQYYHSDHTNFGTWKEQTSEMDEKTYAAE